MVALGNFDIGSNSQGNSQRPPAEPGIKAMGKSTQKKHLS